MLNTIIRNLLSNVLKYTVNDGSINIYSEFDKENISISVVDNGQGIEDYIVENLFTTSSLQSKSGTSGEMGSGVGLIICKDYVERHGGNIWVETEVGIGSKFIFTIPKIEK